MSRILLLEQEPPGYRPVRGVLAPGFRPGLLMKMETSEENKALENDTYIRILAADRRKLTEPDGTDKLNVELNTIEENLTELLSPSYDTEIESAGF